MLAPSAALQCKIDQIASLLHSDRERAASLCKEGLEEARRTGDEMGLLAVARYYGLIMDQLGFPAEAANVLFEALQVAQARHLFSEEVRLLQLIARTYYTVGDYHTALPYWARCSEVADTLGETLTWVQAKIGLGQIYDSFGDHASAVDLHTSAAERLVSCEDPYLFAKVHINLGVNLTKVGKFEAAQQVLEAALATSNEHGFLDYAAEARFRLAEVLMLGSDEDGRVTQELETAEREATASHYVWGLVNILGCRAQVMADLGQIELALQLNVSAQKLAITLDSIHLLSRLHFAASRFAEQGGDAQRALSELKTAYLLEKQIIQKSEPDRLKELEHLTGLRPNANRLLIELSSNPLFDEGDPLKAYQALVQAATQVLGVRRAGVWALTNPNTLDCLAMYDSGQHLVGLRRMSREQYPAFFTWLDRGEPLVAHDAMHHQYTWEVALDDSAPFGISSMLANPIQLSADSKIFLLCKNAGPQRNWTPDDVLHASKLADIGARAAASHERQRFQEQISALDLQWQRERAVVTLAAIGDGVVTTDAGGHIVYLNKVAIGLFGHDEAGRMGQHLSSLLPQLFADEQASALTPWRARRVDLPHASGTLVLDTALSSITGRHDELVGHVLTCRDITETYQLEQKLRVELAAKEAALDALRAVLGGLSGAVAARAGADVADDIEGLSRLIAEVVSEREASRRELDNQKFAMDQHAIVSLTDRHGRFLYANTRFCEISGYSSDELLGSDHRLIRSDLLPKSLYASVYRNLSEGKVWHGDMCHRAKHGQIYWVNTTFVPLLDEAGLPEQFIAIQTDITARKATETALQQAKEAADAANRAKSAFLANMSHEIRTPMNGIIGMTDLVLSTQLSPEQRENLTFVKSSAHALLTIINDILDFSKIEAGKLSIEVVPMSLEDVVRDALGMFHLLAHDKQIGLRCELDPAIPAVLNGDPGRLRQVLVNLVGNAFKFTHSGEVSLVLQLAGLDSEHALLHVAVRDTGIGIAPEKQTHIFDAFSQEDVSTTRRFGGTGLGLSITRKLVELMGGHLWLESVLGEGSTFHFTVSVGIASGGDVEHPASMLSGKYLLLVGGTANEQATLRDWLQDWGLHVDHCDTGDEVMDVLIDPQHKIDVMLVEEQLPDMSGFELAELLQTVARKGENTRMLIMTSKEGIAHNTLAQLMPKPVTETTLLQALASLLLGRALGPM